MANSIVQLAGVDTNINALLPWQVGASIGYNCSAFCIEYQNQRYLMSNYHCECKNENMLLTLPSTGEKYSATVIFASPQCDLMLLDSKICEQLEPVTFEYTIPNVGEKIVTWSIHNGIPHKTSGYFRSLDVVRFPYDSKVSLLIDSTVLGGDSGGPIFNLRNKVIGVMYYGYLSNVPGYGLSFLLIQNFFDRYDYFLKNKVAYSLVGFDIVWQPLNMAKAIKKKYKMPANKTGVLITDTTVLNSYLFAKKLLQKYDILLYINNNVVYDNGTIDLNKAFKLTSTNSFTIPCTAYISTLIPGSKCTLTILRAGDIKTVSFNIQESSIPYYGYIKHILPENTYLKWAGMVFVPLSGELLAYFNDNGMQRVLSYYDDIIRNEKISSDVKLVVLTTVFHHPSLDTYLGYECYIIKSVNDTIVQNIYHLKTVFETCLQQDKFIEIQFYKSPKIIVYETSAIKKLDKTYF